MPRLPLLLLPLILTGCLEDKEIALAQCRLKYDRAPKYGRIDTNLDPYGERVRLCMRTSGFEFARYGDHNCWTQVVNAAAVYWEPDCYNSISLFTKLANMQNQP